MSTVACFTIAVIVAVLLAAVVVPRLAGATPYTILTGSMRPELPPGTLVVVKPERIERLAAGDVITYQLRSGEPAVVTHRIVSVSSTLGGERTLITQGDANTAPDAVAVEGVQVRGKVWYSVPYLGHVNTWFAGVQHELAAVAAGIGLALYAALMFAGGFRDRRRARLARHEGDTHEDLVSAS
jgi:signal peptidase